MLVSIVFACLVSVSLAQQFHECIPNSVVTVKEIKTVPYPPTLSDGFVATYNLGLIQELDGVIDVKLEISKKVGFVWVDVPCINEMGSCTYHDICTQMSNEIDDETCEGLTALNLPCGCPLPTIEYKGDFEVPALDLAGIGLLVSGQYKAKAEIVQGGQVVGCVEGEVEVK